MSSDIYQVIWGLFGFTGLFFIIFSLIYLPIYFYKVKKDKKYKFYILGACGMNEKDMKKFTPNISD